jgi:hypothetical protein
MRLVTLAVFPAALAGLLLFGATSADAAPARSVTAHVRVAAVPMSDERFWSLIAETARTDPDRQIEALEEVLGGLSNAELPGFRDAFQRQLQRAYVWDLWAVAFIAHGGASDDGFEYFRRWMVAQGQAIFERLLANPDDLAEVAPRDSREPLEFEEFASLADRIWAERTGTEMPPPDTGLTSLDLMVAEPAGERFDDNPAALAARFPKTWARFGEAPLG